MRTSIALATFGLALLSAAACGKVGTGDVDASGGDDAPGFDASTVDADPLAPDAGDEPDAPPAVSCTPDAFQDCADAETVVACNATGDGTIEIACGAPGCNAGAGRCNQCVASTQTCDGAVLERCDADGLLLPDVACALTCVDAPAAHCAYLAPRYLADVCDAPATAPTFAPGTVTIDTGLDANCTGGVITQPSGPSFCVIRAGSITLGGTVTVIGSRALALVADDSLVITGTLDAAANGTTNGPGGGLRTSGAQAGTSSAGGGAGFSQAGGAGGSATTDGGGGIGGGVFDPTVPTSMTGGARPANAMFGFNAVSGGGGGAVNLIACRGEVQISGVIDAGGGGGSGGADLIAGAQLEFNAAAGGGSGGYVVIQGLDVTVTGRLFANGGGGGGGAGANDLVGARGGDGTRSSANAATAGAPSSTAGGAGGTGGIGAQLPGTGKHPPGGGTAGGGGGATGAFIVRVPAGVTPTKTPLDISPNFASDEVAATR
jgi:hypothetical protein